MEKKMYAVMLNDIDTMSEDHYDLMGLFETAKEAIEVLHREYQEGIYDCGYVQEITVGEMLKDWADVPYNIVAEFSYDDYTEYKKD